MDERDPSEPVGTEPMEPEQEPGNTPPAPDEALKSENAQLRQEIRTERAKNLGREHQLLPSQVEQLASVPRDQQEATAKRWGDELAAVRSANVVTPRTPDPGAEEPTPTPVPAGAAAFADGGEATIHRDPPPPPDADLKAKIAATRGNPRALEALQEQERAARRARQAAAFE